MSNVVASNIEAYLDQYCQDKNYQVNKSDVNGAIKYDISNGYERIPLMLYHTGKFVPGGSPKLKLKQEFEELKKIVLESPEVLGEIKKVKVKSCAQKYIIIINKIKQAVKHEICTFDAKLKIEENPNATQEYRVKISKNDQSMTATQFSNGTLLLQGKEDSLFDEICDIIEKNGKPSDEEVVTRFLSNNGEVLKEFTKTYTPELMEKAENNIKGLLKDAYNFLDSHDQKWFVAAECLRIANVPLPEFSPIVMPASKAFEGFAKKLLLAIGFYPPTHFAKKEDGFKNLKDKTYSERNTLIGKEKYAGSYIDNLALTLDMSRNFMMHSDSSSVTKVKTPNEASDKLDKIINETKELFNYFNKPEFGGIYP